MQKKLLVATIAASLALSGCSVVLPIDDYQDVSIEKADVMPTKEAVAGKKETIVIFAPTSGGNRFAKEANLGLTFASNLERVLTDVGVEVVDRSTAKTLKKELWLAETKGKSEYKGPDVSDFAITGKISDASLTYDFHERKTWYDDDGDFHERDAYCRFEATVSAQLKIYRLPGLVQSKSIPVAATSSSTTKTSNSSCPISNSSADALIKKAVKFAISKKESQFKNAFTPKAYIVERRELNGDNIFKLSTGTRLGLVGGSNVNVYTKKVSTNKITDEVMIEELKIAVGEVADEPLSENYSWIVIDDEEVAEKIRLGDYIKRVHSKSPNEWVADMLGQK